MMEGKMHRLSTGTVEELNKSTIEAIRNVKSVMMKPMDIFCGSYHFLVKKPGDQEEDVNAFYASLVRSYGLAHWDVAIQIADGQVENLEISKSIPVATSHKKVKEMLIKITVSIQDINYPIIEVNLWLDVDDE
jgi:hypothetical protein